jgi:hypothetical protein
MMSGETASFCSGIPRPLQLFDGMCENHDFRAIQRALGIEPTVIHVLSRTRRHFVFRFERPLEEFEPTSAYRSHLRIASGGNSYYLLGTGSLTGSEVANDVAGDAP